MPDYAEYLSCPDARIEAVQLFDVKREDLNGGCYMEDSRLDIFVRPIDCQSGG
jgi:hypothetical protein